MKKLIALLAALVMALALICAASAETILPKPVTVDIDNLEGRMVRTDIEYREGDVMTLTLYETERFDADAILGAQVGDVIVTGGEEVTVESIEADGPDICFNRGTETEMLFCDAGKDEFEHVGDNDCVPFVLIGTLEREILEYYPIIDQIDPVTGEPYDEFTVYRGDRLKELLQNPEAVGFNCKNVDVVYDRNNMIVMIMRYYSPMQ